VGLESIRVKNVRRQRRDLTPQLQEQSRALEQPEEKLTHKRSPTAALAERAVAQLGKARWKGDEPNFTAQPPSGIQKWTGSQHC
jgi:hypothetical protein